MTALFTRERFGRPQFLAGALLLAFLLQTLWLVHSEIHSTLAPEPSEQVRIAAGWRQLHGGAIAGAPYPDPPSTLPLEISSDADNFDTQHSPLLSLVTAAPLLAWPQRLLTQESSLYWRWLPRLPFLLCGLLLGASLWYVARRLCGNHGRPSRPHPLLFFSRHDSVRRRLAHRARNFRRLGIASAPSSPPSPSPTPSTPRAKSSSGTGAASCCSPSLSPSPSARSFP